MPTRSQSTNRKKDIYVKNNFLLCRIYAFVWKIDNKYILYLMTRSTRKKIKAGLKWGLLKTVVQGVLPVKVAFEDSPEGSVEVNPVALWGWDSKC